MTRFDFKDWFSLLKNSHSSFFDLYRYSYKKPNSCYIFSYTIFKIKYVV